MKRLPVIAALMAAGLAAVLFLGDRDQPSPQVHGPDVTTTSTFRPALRTWGLLSDVDRQGDPYDSWTVTSVVDFDLDRTVTRLHRTAPGVVGSGVLYDEKPAGALQGWIRLAVRLKVEGSGTGYLWIAALGDRSVLGTAGTPDGAQYQAGGWERHVVPFQVPEGTISLRYGIGLNGAGDLYVDRAALAP